MGNKIFDNAGFEVGAPESAHPVLASGFELHASAAGTEYSLTVSCGEQFCITCNAEGPLLLGVTGDITSEANREWVIPANGRLKITIPEVGTATRALHFGSEKSDCIGYGVKLDVS